jgi:triacylglycerol esterase/lipase EstA (alpha/beta hydrolase family)
MELRRGGSARSLAMTALVFATAILVSLATAGVASADTSPYAPLNRAGPPLSVASGQLRAAVACTAGVAGDSRNPILLVPGTDLDPGPNYSWNYERALAALHWPYCTVTLPAHTTGDIQVAGEYVVYALRRIARLAGRKVDVLGYSQGGMLPRWALRFWPDTRALVHDLVALDPSNHGTVDANLTCQQQCSAADWQQASTAHFIDALNSGAETFAGIDYTVIYSRTDEIVVPNFDASGSSSLHTGGGHIANIAVQEICPNDASEHLAMGSYDPVGYALAVDAFTHTGTADPSRISTAVCAQPFQPGVDPSTFASDYTGYLNAIGQAQQNAPQVPAEPPLRCYVFASCRSAAQRATHQRTGHKRRRRHRRTS